MRNAGLGLNLAALIAAISAGIDSRAVAAATTGRRGQRGLKNITGPATNWPSGKIHRKPRGDSGQHPKFAKARKHKPHHHELRDENGAFTVVGRGKPEITGTRPRRMWLAGISAQRGY